MTSMQRLTDRIRSLNTYLDIAERSMYRAIEDDNVLKKMQAVRVQTIVKSKLAVIEFQVQAALDLSCQAWPLEYTETTECLYDVQDLLNLKPKYNEFYKG